MPPASCPTADAYTAAAWALAGYTALFLLSRVVSPLLFPNTYRRLRAEPGQCAYWDASVCSSVNGFVNAALALQAFRHDPSLFTSGDGYHSTPLACRANVVFVAWVCFESVMQAWNWGLWDGKWGMLVHHSFALAAWLLYLTGGYGQALGLIGLISEATNPAMNMRYFLSTVSRTLRARLSPTSRAPKLSPLLL